MKVVKWLAVIIVSLGLGGGAALWASDAIPSLSAHETEPETHNTEVINAISRTEQVALLSLGIQGISESTDENTIFGVRVPGSKRATFLQYGFNAKLGIEGGDVRVDQLEGSRLRVSIPEFIFIGHDQVTFQLAAEKNGILSWTTPEIDNIETINSILDGAAQREYIDNNVEVLRDQAEAFYRTIIRSVDPAIEVEFVFDA